MTILNSFKKYITSSILCLRFPFLYPRNRFSGRNHVYWGWLSKLYNKLDKKAYYDITLGYEFYKNPEDCKETNKEVQLGNYNIQLFSTGILMIRNPGLRDITTFDLQKHVGKDFEITGITLRDGWKLHPEPFLIYHVHRKEVCNVNYGFCHRTIRITVNKWAEKLRDIVWFIWTEIIDRIFIIPSTTELSAMPEGWKKVYGIQICKEIRKSLLLTVINEEHPKYPWSKLWAYIKGVRYLLNYRITQIKEKYAVLTWYDMRSTRGVHAILDKYEDITLHTCISCGKPATRISLGWYCPFCDDCAPEKSVSIEKFLKNDISTEEE